MSGRAIDVEEWMYDLLAVKIKLEDYWKKTADLDQVFFRDTTL